MIAELSQPDAWLTGYTILYFLRIIASCTKRYAAIDVDLEKEAIKTPAILTDSAILDIRGFMWGINTGAHWALICGAEDGKLADYNSLPCSSYTHAKVMKALRRIPPWAGDRRIEAVNCPRQRDGHSCGVFTIVFAMYVAAGVEIPRELHVANWRLLLQAWTKRCPLSSILPVEEDNEVATEPTSAVPAPATLRVSSGGVSLENLGSEAQELNTRFRGIHSNAMYEIKRRKTRRDERLRPLSEWLTTEVAPVIDGLLKSAVDAVSHLEQKSVVITTSQTQLEVVRREVRKLAVPGRRVENISAETQKLFKDYTRLKTRIIDRIDDAKKAQAALQGLCIQDLRVRLDDALREGDKMVSRAETAMHEGGAEE